MPSWDEMGCNWGFQVGVYSHKSDLFLLLFSLLLIWGKDTLPKLEFIIVRLCSCNSWMQVASSENTKFPEYSNGEKFCFILATSPLIPLSEEPHGIKQTGNVWLLSNPLSSSPFSESKHDTSARAWQPAAAIEWWETHRIYYRNTWVSPSSAAY